MTTSLDQERTSDGRPEESVGRAGSGTVDVPRPVPHREHLLDTDPAPDAQIESYPGWGTETASICVFAPCITLTVTIERVDRVEPWGEIHLHPGGQGFWIARLLAQMGYRTLLCGPVGGETGAVLESIVPQWGVSLRGVKTDTPNPSVIDDRRSGDRVQIARDQRLTLHRHEIDDLYGRVLQLSLGTDVTVVTGRAPEDTMPLHVYRRLGADLAALGARAVGDLHGPELHAFLENGRLAVLKVSDEDLLADGAIADDSDAEVRRAIEELAATDRIEWIVVSQADRGAIVAFEGGVHRATQPTFEVVDRRGSGDSMTAGLVAARLRGLSAEEAIRLACAAGAANVIRHGLGSASAELIDQIARQVEIDPIERHR